MFLLPPLHTYWNPQRGAAEGRLHYVCRGGSKNMHKYKQTCITYVYLCMYFIYSCIVPYISPLSPLPVELYLSFARDCTTRQTAIASWWQRTLNNRDNLMGLDWESTMLPLFMCHWILMEYIGVYIGG